LDGITGEIQKRIWKSVPEHLMSLYSRCIENGNFPKIWKQPRIYPDKIKSKPEAYRGFCLLPVLGTLKKAIMIMINRLKDILPERNRWQFGFTTNKCTY
ncbi:hypothetical protein KR067_012001, partial [Drosophila pandora]